MRLLLDSCGDFRRGCLSATRWTTQFKSLISKGLYSPEKSFTAKVLIDGTMLVYLFNACPPRFKPLLFVSVLHTISVSMNSKGPGQQKSFTHFEHRAGKVG